MTNSIHHYKLANLPWSCSCKQPFSYMHVASSLPPLPIPVCPKIPQKPRTSQSGHWQPDDCAGGATGPHPQRGTAERARAACPRQSASRPVGLSLPHLWSSRVQPWTAVGLLVCHIHGDLETSTALTKFGLKAHLLLGTSQNDGWGCCNWMKHPSNSRLS